MSNPDDHRIYDALALPNEALTDGGVEILRAGIINEELYVMARRAFNDPARWGEVLADIARQLALYQSAEDTALTEQEILTQIEQAFAADLGAPELDESEPASVKRAASAKSKKPAKSAKKAAKPAKAKSKASAKASAKSRPKPTKRKRR